MPVYIVDTNVLVRRANAGDKLHGDAVRAVHLLASRGNTLRTLPQCVVEFRSGATRPESSNGLGLSPPDVDDQLR